MLETRPTTDKEIERDPYIAQRVRSVGLDLDWFHTFLKDDNHILDRVLGVISRAVRLSHKKSPRANLKMDCCTASGLAQVLGDTISQMPHVQRFSITYSRTHNPNEPFPLHVQPWNILSTSLQSLTINASLENYLMFIDVASTSLPLLRFLSISCYFDATDAQRRSLVNDIAPFINNFSVTLNALLLTLPRPLVEDAIYGALSPMPNLSHAGLFSHLPLTAGALQFLKQQAASLERLTFNLYAAQGSVGEGASSLSGLLFPSLREVDFTIREPRMLESDLASYLQHFVNYSSFDSLRLSGVWLDWLDRDVLHCLSKAARLRTLHAFVRSLSISFLQLLSEELPSLETLLVDYHVIRVENITEEDMSTDLTHQVNALLYRNVIFAHRNYVDTFLRGLAWT